MAPTLPPRADLPLRERIRCLREFHTGAVLLQQRYGRVCRLELAAPGVPTVVFVSSAAGAHDVLAVKDGSLDKTGKVHRESRLFGMNSFNMAHADWTPRRRTLQPVFTRQHVESYAGHMSAVAAEMAAGWNDRGVDLDHEMRHVTLEVLGRSLFGVPLGGDASQRLAQALPTMLTYITRRITSPVTASPGMPTPARHRFRKALGVVQSVVEEAVAAYRRDPDHSPAELIRLLHEARDPHTGAQLTSEEIRDELIVFLIAGHDTTATTLTYALWQLGHHPELQDAVADEVAGLGHERLQAADLHALPLTTRVLHESMRLCPAAPALGRRVMRDTVIDGYLVPAGSEVLLSIYALHRDPEAWDDPLTFDPDRFLPERADARDRWQYLPFGGGPRKCVGANFAMLEAVIGLATLVRQVEVVSLLPTFDVALPFTMTAAGEVPARVTRRQVLGASTHVRTLSSN
jgi:cytochrome P450